MDQDKLEIFKKELARVNVNILGNSELKWTAMGGFNSDDHYIYYCGKESLRRDAVVITVNRSPKCSPWMQSRKRQNDRIRLLIVTTTFLEDGCDSHSQEYT